MRITKRQLRRIIREEAAYLIDECPNPETNMPCPIHTAAELRSAGASGEDVLHWIDLLISEFNQGSEVAPPDEVDYTGDLSDLAPDEAFGLGYNTGEQGL